MNFKGQASFEFLFILGVVLVLIIVSLYGVFKENKEISALGVVKTNIDSYLLKNNLNVDYKLETNINDSNIIIIINSSNDFDESFLEDLNNTLKTEFNNVFLG